MLPFVKLAGSPENFPVRWSVSVIVWLGGIGPALLFLRVEKLRLLCSDCSQWENAALSLLFAFGTVYFFTAVEGTVWFAAHVVGVALLAAYFFVSIGARNPLISWTHSLCGLDDAAGHAFHGRFFRLRGTAKKWLSR